MRQILLLLCSLILTFGCSSKAVSDPELNDLVSLMVGEFSNEEQTQNDSSYPFLRLVNIKIWKDRPGHWVYSELFDAKDENRVYGQRILHYERVDSLRFQSTSYKILNAKDYNSSWKHAKLLNTLTLDSLEVREGCQVYFVKNTSTIYSGKTNKKTCSSSIKHVDYITSDFVVSRDKISIWNRGYNKEGKQVWGKIKGPFKYKRITDK